MSFLQDLISAFKFAEEEVKGTTEVITENLEENAEQDGTVELDDIAWESGNDFAGKSLLGKPTRPIYYSQADKRWGSLPYTSCGNPKQTISSSGCGPTSAAMVVSASKGAILPPEMANLFVKKGFRTKENGTAWSVWPFVADYFGFKEYHTTTKFDTMLDYIKSDNNKDKVSDYFVVASCGPGLFTTSGHYIAIVGYSNGEVRVHDPSYYYGKYTTASRRAANVRMEGNIAYVTVENLRKYGNFKSFWIFSNDRVIKTKKPVRYIKKIGTIVRKGPGKKYKEVDKLKKNTKVKVYKTKGDWTKIGKKRWVYSKFLSASQQKEIVYKTKVGKKYILKEPAVMYEKGDLKGRAYSYKKNTTVKILKHYNAKVDYVYAPATGREAYIEVRYLKEA